MRDELAAFLGERLGRAAEIEQLERITVGHSRAMYRVDLTSGERFVVRMEQGGVFATSGVAEFEVMRWLHQQGVPVAAVRWLEASGEVLGRPFFVMDFVAATRPPADERLLSDDGARALVAALHDLHEIDVPADTGPFEPVTADEAVHRTIDHWTRVHHDAVPVPVPLLAEAEVWLHHHAPPVDRVSVVHGDAGPGNAIVDGDRVLALADFEFAHLGDRREDWAFCITMRGRATMPRERWLALIEDVAGDRFGAGELAYWEALNLYKGACANLTARALFESGGHPRPNMAIIGSRHHQVFLRRLADVVSGAAG